MFRLQLLIFDKPFNKLYTNIQCVVVVLFNLSHILLNNNQIILRAAMYTHQAVVLAKRKGFFATMLSDADRHRSCTITIIKNKGAGLKSSSSSSSSQYQYIVVASTSLVLVQYPHQQPVRTRQQLAMVYGVCMMHLIFNIFIITVFIQYITLLIRYEQQLYNSSYHSNHIL